MSRKHHDYGAKNKICSGHNSRDDWKKLGWISGVIVMMFVIGITPHLLK